MLEVELPISTSHGSKDQRLELNNMHHGNPKCAGHFETNPERARAQQHAYGCNNNHA